MKLSDFDGKCVRIVDNHGDVFEGICIYNCAEYNELELGHFEEGLQLSCLSLYKSEIREITSLEDRQGPYGKFSAPYGKLEEITVEDGIDLIDEVFLSEEPEHIYRLLLCLKSHIEAGLHFEQTEELIHLLKDLLQTDLDERTKKEAEKLIEMLS